MRCLVLVRPAPATSRAPVIPYRWARHDCVPTITRRDIGIWNGDLYVRYGSSSARTKTLEELTAGVEQWIKMKEQRLERKKKAEATLPPELKLAEAWLESQEESPKKKSPRVVINTHEPVQSFGELGAHPALVQKLTQLGITQPTPVQIMSFKHILQSRHVLMRSATGTGKTLAFLLPLFTRLLSKKQLEKHLQVVVMVPTPELAIQILNDMHTLVGKDPAFCREVLFPPSITDCAKALEDLSKNIPRVIISTPAVLLEFTKQEQFKEVFKHVDTVVVDEIDRILRPLSIYATKKEKEVRRKNPRPGTVVLEALQKCTYQLQLVCSSATINTRLKRNLFGLGFKEQYVIEAGEGFRPPSGIEHKAVIVRHAEEKIQELVKTFRQLNIKSALAFVKTEDPIRAVIEDMRFTGLNAVALFEEMSKSSNISQFIERFKNGDVEVVVTTEEGARGLNFDWLSHVFILSPPNDANSYLHLAGRTGRFGRKGTAISFVEERELTYVKQFSQYLNISFMELRDNGEEVPLEFPEKPPYNKATNTTEEEGEEELD